MKEFYRNIRSSFISYPFRWDQWRLLLLILFIISIATAMSTFQVMMRYDNEGSEKWWMYYFIRQLPKWSVWLVFTPVLSFAFQKIIVRNQKARQSFFAISGLIVVTASLLATAEGFSWYLLNSPTAGWDLTRVVRAFLVSQTFFHVLIAFSILMLLMVRQLYWLTRQRKSNGLRVKETSNEQKMNGSLVLKHRGRTELIPLTEIVHLSASGSYVEIYTSKGKTITTGSLKNLADQLPFPAFLRIHRSFIVRSDVVKDLIPLTNEDYKVITHSGHELRLSRTYKESLSFLLGATQSHRPAN